MTAGVVTVGRQRYAVGLYWENSPGGGRVAQIARDAARQPGQQADFYCVRPGNKDGRVPQFGLCSSEAGQKPSMPVLAGCLAVQIPGSWAGAFRLPDGFVVTVVRDDLVVPDGDLFFADEASARDRLIQEVGFGGLQTIYAPEAWGIPGADTIPLTLLLSNQTDIRLQRVTVSKEAKFIVAGLSLLFVVALGVVWYQGVKEDELQQEEQKKKAIALQDRAAQLPSFVQQRAPEAKYDRKWEKEARPMEVVNACREGLSQVPAAWSGWKLLTLRCSGSTMTLSWRRSKGTSSPPPGAVPNETGNSAAQTITLPPLSPRGSDPLLDIDDITKRYLYQDWPGSIARTGDDPLPPPPDGYTGPWAPPPPPWIKRSFTLTVSELPSSLPEYIGSLPGVVINNMNCTPSAVSCAWTVEGVIYENRK